MASLKAREPGSIETAEPMVPASMFAPDREEDGYESGEESFEGGEETDGESADLLDLSNKVGLTLNGGLPLTKYKRV